MKRIVIILVAVAAICMVLVQIRRDEARVRHEIHRRLAHQTSLRRELWNQRVKVAHLLAPREVRRRTEEMALDLKTHDGSDRLAAIDAERGYPDGGER